MLFQKRRNDRLSIRASLFLFFTALLFVSFMACSKKTIVVPSITPQPTHLRHVGKFVWYDLFTDNLDTASRFYEGLFGWSFSNTIPGRGLVKTIQKDGIPIGNAVYIDPQKQKTDGPVWLCYMSVVDVDDSAVLVKMHEGSIQMDPKNLPQRGRVAVVKDPEGAMFAIMTATGGDPPDQDPIVNNWLGTELWVRNPGVALEFYRELVGYELKMMDLDTRPGYRLLVRDNQTRAGIVKIPWEGIEPNWLPYVVVEDATFAAQKAEALGGTILIAPDERIREGAVAIIADPCGAVFAVQQF